MGKRRNKQREGPVDHSRRRLLKYGIAGAATLAVGGSGLTYLLSGDDEDENRWTFLNQDYKNLRKIDRRKYYPVYG